MPNIKRVVDLTITVFPGMSRPAVIRDFDIVHLATVEKDGYDVSDIHLSAHTGTHFDAPKHFVRDGLPLEGISPDKFMGEAVVLDLTALPPRHQIGKADLEPFAKRVRPGDIVLLHTGSDKWLDQPEYATEYPYIGLSAARWLVEKKAAAVGMDFMSADCLSKEPLCLDAHVTLLGAGVVIIECLANLQEIKAARPFFIAAPLKIRGGEASPVRALALEFE